jgi:hypothetical protein
MLHGSLRSGGQLLSVLRRISGVVSADLSEKIELRRRHNLWIASMRDVYLDFGSKRTGNNLEEAMLVSVAEISASRMTGV